MTLHRVLIPLFLAFLLPDAQAILIDGHVKDWDRIQPLPIPADTSTYSSRLGEIAEMKVSQDDDFVYVYLKFAEPRPFTSTGHQKELRSGVWDDFSYVEFDRNGDGVWDYATRMVKGKRIGVNNLAVLSRIPGQNAGRIVLFPEGHKDYRPLGPRAFFSADSQTVELRVPRLPLRLQSGVVYIRARTHYRDDRSGASQWIERYFPDGDGWVALELRPLQNRGVGGTSNSPARMREPTIPRRQFENEIGPRYARYPGAYMYPWREIEPSEDLNARARDPFAVGESDADIKPKRPPKSVIVVTPDGQVRTGTPGTSSPNPEEGQGVPAEVQPIFVPDSAQEDLSE